MAKTDGEEKRGRGRPSDYTPELADAICEAIATSQQGLNQLCATRDDFPVEKTVYVWMSVHEDFQQNVTRARERQAEKLIFDGHMDLADVDPDEGNGNARVSKAKALADYRGKMAGWIAPRKYGNKLGIEHSGSINFAGLMAKADDEAREDG